MCDYKPDKTPSIALLNPYALNASPTCHRDFYDPDNLDHKDGYSYRGMLLKNIQGLNQDGKGGIWWQKSLAIYPIRKSDRLTSQDGFFTIQGSDSRPIEEQIDEENNIWKKVVQRKAE